MDHDPSASAGIPPHVTLMYPFLPPAHLTEQVVNELERLAANVTPFDFVLTNVREFGQGVVYLEPEPAEPFVTLSNEIGRRFGLLPFGGEFGDVLLPHLTLAMPQVHSATQRIADTLAPVLPIKLHADQAWLMVGDSKTRWTRTRRLPFRGVSLRDLTDFSKRWPDGFESPHGFSVKIAEVHYPAVTMRYTEGDHHIDVYAEALAGFLDFALSPGSIDHWSPPHESERIDDATRERILERIEAALEFGGYKVDRDWY